MATHKKFFMYAIGVIVFFIFSQIMINVALNTTYKDTNIKVNTEIFKEVKAQATSINGFVQFKIDNNAESEIKDKYIKLEAYSNNNTLMGDKYIKVEDIEKDKNGVSEIRFNFNRVENVILDITDQMPETITEEQKKSDPRMNIVMMISAYIFLITFG